MTTKRPHRRWVCEVLIRENLTQVEDFLHAESALDPLSKLALIHYQFQAIHPFFDGNGRTGRIVNILVLVKEKLLTLPVLYLSQHIIEHKATTIGSCVQ